MQLDYEEFLYIVRKYQEENRGRYNDVRGIFDSVLGGVVHELMEYLAREDPHFSRDRFERLSGFTFKKEGQ